MKAPTLVRSALPALALLAALPSGCAARGPATPAPAASSEAQEPAPPSDPLGPRPELGPPRPYLPPEPRRIAVPGLPEIWLVERHGLPLVGVVVVVPSGSASDPPGRGGLAALTAEMMEQGAGERDALALSLAVERLGARMEVGARFDWSAASLAVLKDNLAPALEILADVVARPRFEAAEWERIQPLWLGDLQSRAHDPRQVAEVAGLAALFGEGHPYGHPVDGTVATASAVTLDDVRRFHARAWRPERARIVVAGDVTEAEVRDLFSRVFARWRAPEAEEAVPVVVPDPPPAERPRLVLVDRPGSPQTVLRLMWPGPAAGDASQTALQLVNIPLGGSFTSRLNQNLREDKGYTYGARSSVPFTRGPGAFVAYAAVQTEVTGPALSEMLKELDRMAAEGPTDEEVAKARSTARNDDVETYEGVFGTANRLALLAGLGLPPDRDVQAARTREAVDAEAIRQAARAVDADGAVVVVVGDRSRIEPQIAALGLPAPEIRDAEGAIVSAAPAEAR